MITEARHQEKSAGEEPSCPYRHHTFRPGFALGLLCLLAVLWAARARAEIISVNLDRSYPVVEAENSFWIGTPGGLHQYSPGDDTFRRVALPDEMSGSEIREMRYSDEWLWCLTDRGLGALHVRLNEWLFFDASSGLPADEVTGIAFEGDYVWVSTAAGAARFDLLIEEWETLHTAADLPDLSLKDIVAAGGRIWTIGQRYVSEYDPTFEKWRHYKVEHDTLAGLVRAFTSGRDLWLVAGDGLIRFDTELQSQQAFLQSNLAHPHLLDLVIEDEAIWALGRTGIYRYDSDSQVWLEFEGNAYIRDSNPVGFHRAPSAIWVLSDKGVSVWDDDGRSWEMLDYASGLSLSSYRAVHTGGGSAFLIGDKLLDYRRSADEGWRQYVLPEAAAGTGGDLFNDLFDNEEGGHIRVGPWRWGWEGTRITLLRDYEWYFADGASAGDPAVESGERLDVKSRIGIGGERTLSGFYNNIDYSETMYGVRCRDRGETVVKEVGWGDFRREPGATPFGQPANMFGTNVWLQAGPKTDRFKRSLVTIKAETGERRSEKVYQHLRGASTEFETGLSDTDYLKNQYYYVPGMMPEDRPAEFRVYVDDMTAASNTPNTMERLTIAGISGDFDAMIPTEDYHLYPRAAAVAFLIPVQSHWTVIVTYSLDGTAREEVLQYGDAVSTASRNIYYMGGRKIIPYSFELGIRDSLDEAVPLSDFGIDRNGDGSVDSEWIDYESGILLFPADEPFPPEVYDEAAPRSLYRIAARFETRISLIRLEHDDLVRGSEVLRLDGDAAQSGNDYVLDYTNGTLVFVREGIVNPDTRIEIEYEYYPGEELSQVSGATLNISPSDNLYVQGDWVRIEDGDTSSEPTDVASIHAEIRRKLSSYDIRITPGLAYQGDRDRLGAGYVDGLVSSNTLRFQARYEDYSQVYANLYRPQSILGPVADNLDLFASFDVRPDVRLTGEWNRTGGYDASGGEATRDRTGSATLLIHPVNLPSWEVSYRDFKTVADSGRAEKQVIENRLKYQLPKAWSAKVRLQSLKAETLLRTGSQRGQPMFGTEDQEFHQGHVRLNASVSDRFQGGFFYRRSDLYDTSGDGRPPVTRSERSLLTLSHEEWPVLHVNLRAENTLDRGFHRGTGRIDARLSQYSQLNARLFPGRLVDALSSVDLEFNVNRATAGSGGTGARATGWLWEFFNEATKGLLDAQATTAYLARSEYRPSTYLYVHTLFEWNHGERTMGGSSLASHYRLWNEKIEIKLGLKTRLTMQYSHYFQDLGWQRTLKYRQPSVWVEHRWTRDLQNLADLTFRHTRSEDGEIGNSTRDWSGRCDLVWSRQGLVGMDRLEMRHSLSGSHCQTSGDDPENTYNLTFTSSLDLYPVLSTIIRSEVRFTSYWDDLDPENDYSTLAVDLKLSMKF